MAERSATSSAFESLWELPRSRLLRRQILLLFGHLVDPQNGLRQQFLAQQSAWLRSLTSCAAGSHDILKTALEALQAELGLLPTADVLDARVLSGEASSLMACALHVHLEFWLSRAVLEAYPELAKAGSFGSWLTFCSSRYEPLSLQLAAAMEGVASREMSDVFVGLLQDEHDFYSKIVVHTTGRDEIQTALLQAAKIVPPRVLIIAGSDSGGGAGLQADLKSCTVHGAFGSTAVTALTAQNSRGVQGIFPVPVDFLMQQMDSVLSDIGTDVVKTGMLATAEIVKAVAESLKVSRPSCPRLVVDPVMVSTSGHKLLEDDAIQSLKDELFPHATLITPNLPEACLLLGLAEINEVSAMEDAARQLASMGPRWVLVKGGHLANGSDSEAATATDVLCHGETGECFRFESKLVANTRHTHGTGCTLASSIAALLAKGLEVPQAVEEAKAYVRGAIASSAHLALGSGKQGPMNHSWPYFKW